MFKGSCVAIVTPLTAADTLDESALVDLVEWHVAEGTAAIVVAGSTGEGATLSEQEQQRMLTLVCQTVKKQIPVIAATGTNTTRTTIERTQIAQTLGADACLVVTPYYNRPTQGGLVAHYTALTQATTVPIILYNVPSRTACDLLPETVEILSKIPSIIGIKEATGKIERIAQLQNCDKDFLLYSGDDPTARDFIHHGGHGVISITANIAPRFMQAMCRAALDNDLEKSREINDTLASLHRLLCIESNPIPVKWALSAMGKMHQALRLPLTTLSPVHQDTVRQALQTAGLL